MVIQGSDVYVFFRRRDFMMNAIVILALYAWIRILHSQMLILGITNVGLGLTAHFIDAAITIGLYMLMKEAKKHIPHG